MSSFKEKQKKLFRTNNITTLDMKHNTIMEHFKKRKELLPKKQKHISKLESEYSKLEQKTPDTYTESDIQRKAELKESIEQLKQEVYNISNNIDEINYYSKTADILSKYYDLVNNKIENLESFGIDETEESVVSEGVKSQLDILNERNLKNRIRKPSIRKSQCKISNCANILDFFSEPDKKLDDKKEDEVKHDRAELFDKYLLLVDPQYISKYKYLIRVKKCLNCEVEKTLYQNDGAYVCPICGESESAIIESYKPSFKEQTQENNGYPYKRINHFNEWLSQIQGKETTEIPDEIFTSIKKEISKSKIKKLSELVPNKMRKILKKLGLNRYYEHIPHIINRINGIPPPNFSRETEEIFRNMFRDIQEPFKLYKPKNRKNFLSYSYVLNKFCRITGFNEFVKCFPLLKSREKLQQQDEIWKKICIHLGWAFHPSE